MGSDNPRKRTHVAGCRSVSRGVTPISPEIAATSQGSEKSPHPNHLICRSDHSIGTAGHVPTGPLWYATDVAVVTRSGGVLFLDHERLIVDSHAFAGVEAHQSASHYDEVTPARNRADHR